MWYTKLIFGLVVNTINIPYDNGANIQGSKNSPKDLLPYLDFLNIEKSIDIDVNNFVTNILNDGYYGVLEVLCDEKFPITIGGDHTISVSSVAAMNDYCIANNKRLGILWCDAHADFNTMETSPTKNIHGMPIAILCGHTLQNLKIGEDLDPEQFAYYGLRDVDYLENIRVKEHNIPIITNNSYLDKWIEKFDSIYISFDIDCLDPSVTDCVNTPVANGLSVEDIKRVFNRVKRSNKLCGLDIVEYNSDKGDDHTIIVDIVKTLLTDN